MFLAIHSVYHQRKGAVQLDMDTFILKEVRKNCAFLRISQLKSYHNLFFINLKSKIYCSRRKSQADIFDGSPFLNKVQRDFHFTAPYPFSTCRDELFFPSFERGRELQAYHSQAGTKLDQSLESQFWDTKDVLSPCVHLYMVLKAAASI